MENMLKALCQIGRQQSSFLSLNSKVSTWRQTNENPFPFTCLFFSPKSGYLQTSTTKLPCSFYPEWGLVVFQMTMFFGQDPIVGCISRIAQSNWARMLVLPLLLHDSSYIIDSSCVSTWILPQECSGFSVKNQYEKPSHVSFRLGSAPKSSSFEVIYASPGNWKANTLLLFYIDMYQISIMQYLWINIL